MIEQLFYTVLEQPIIIILCIVIFIWTLFKKLVLKPLSKVAFVIGGGMLIYLIYNNLY